MSGADGSPCLVFCYVPIAGLYPCASLYPCVAVSDSTQRWIIPPLQKGMYIYGMYVYCLPSSKSLTSWAQKLKQNQPKRVNTEEVRVNTMQGNEQAKKSPLENTDSTDAALPPYTFYLNQPTESPNSVVSETSGLSYWKLDVKEMYHSLPENFRSEFADVFSSKVSPDQVNFAHVLGVVL
ncbi:UNVERIFIED_CONTAM: hypothetical protein H355_016082 [Colinus virginianus]|nr:hypothetical protein H355_016082 [Colinus virginianus]